MGNNAFTSEMTRESEFMYHLSHDSHEARGTSLWLWTLQLGGSSSDIEDTRVSLLQLALLE